MVLGAQDRTTPWVVWAVVDMRRLLELAELWVIIGPRMEALAALVRPRHTVEAAGRSAGY